MQVADHQRPELSARHTEPRADSNAAETASKLILSVGRRPEKPESGDA